MSTTRPTTLATPADLWRLLSEQRTRWIVPTVLVTIVALGYAVFRTATWEASQALVVRNEAHGTGQRPGKFALPDEMKTVQETIMELAKSESVLRHALQKVGPLNSTVTPEWPTERDIAAIRDAVKLTPPHGAEFGKTEMFYLNVQADDRGRAIALATAICDGLDARFGQLQEAKAGSMISELQKTLQVAEETLQTATKNLSKLEQSVGSDLSELRILNEFPSGSSDLRQKVIACENELRDAQNNHRGIVELTALLRNAQTDNSKVAALPDRLLKSHTALVKLIEGLSAARLRTSSLLGSKAEAHPLVQAARAEEEEVLNDLRKELGNAVHIAQTEERLAQDRIDLIERQLTDTQTRLTRLATLRAEYANRVAESKSRATVVEEARRNLSDANAAQTAARTTSQITRVDEPTTGARPIGPGKSMIVLAGMLAGLAIGFGIVFLTVRPTIGVPTNEFATGRGHNGHDTVEHMLKGQSLTLKQALSKITGDPARN